MLYRWVGNLVCYMIFITMLTGLLPAGKYEKYIRLFSGCILVLLVLWPFTGSLRLEEQISGLFKTFSFENEARELQGGLDEMEKKRLELLIGQYEETAAAEAARIAGGEGFLVKEAAVEIQRDEASQDFGRVKRIRLRLAPAGEATPEQAASGQEKTEQAASGQEEKGQRTSGAGGKRKESGASGKISVAVEPVKPVQAGNGGQQEQEAAAPARALSGAAGRLREKLAVYYQVEAEHVEIEMENRSGVDEEK